MDHRDAVFEASDFLTENMAYFALIDANYRGQGVSSNSNIDKALLRVYSAILTFAAKVKKERDKNEAGKRGSIVKSRPRITPINCFEASTWNSIFAFTD